MNFTEINLDLQGVAKRIYDSLLYRSAFYKMLNPNYIGEIRRTGTPVIEVLKSQDTSVNVRETKEIASAITPSLQGYSSIKVDLTDLPMDYSIRIPVLVAGSNIMGTLEDAMDKKDQAVAKAIDTYGFGKLETEVETERKFDPETKEEYIDELNAIKAVLFNKNVYEDYRLALSATEYAKLISALTSVIKYETAVGVKGVDMGTVSEAYGIEIFPVNDSVLGDVKGYAFNPRAVVGDSFFDSMQLFNGNYPGFPGYFVIESNILFGAEVVEQNAIIKLVEKVSA